MLNEERLRMHYRKSARYITYTWILDLSISQSLNLFIGTPRICNFILLLIVWVCSFSEMLLSVKFAEDEVLIFVILREKC